MQRYEQAREKKQQENFYLSSTFLVCGVFFTILSSRENFNIIFMIQEIYADDV